MRNWLKFYQSANIQIKLFVWIFILFGLAIILSTVYPYARLFEPFS